MCAMNYSNYALATDRRTCHRLFISASLYSVNRKLSPMRINLSTLCGNTNKSVLCLFHGASIRASTKSRHGTPTHHTCAENQMDFVRIRSAYTTKSTTTRPMALAIEERVRARDEQHKNECVFATTISKLIVFVNLAASTKFQDQGQRARELSTSASADDRTNICSL